MARVLLGTEEQDSSEREVSIMGLDMWLIKKKKSKGVKVAYWRKANAIHGWFVDNIQDGVDDQNEYYVSKEKLEELKKL